MKWKLVQRLNNLNMLIKLAGFAGFTGGVRVGIRLGAVHYRIVRRGRHLIWIMIGILKVSGVRFMPFQRGFTLIEMLVVIAIVALLATLAVPSYMSSVAREQVTESLRLVEQLKPAIERYHRETASLPPANQDAGIPAPDKLIGNYVSSIDLENGAFHIRFGNKAVTALDGKQLSVRAIIVEGSPDSPISWVCGYSSVPTGMKAEAPNHTSIEPAGLLPVSCRNLGKN